MNIDGFRSVADRPNAVVTVDLKSAQLKVRNNHVFNRAISWLRRRISSDPSRDLAMDAARNRFLQAIGDRRSGYDSADVSRARDLLADDIGNHRPLSSRRIREVLDDLDRRSSAATRVNRRVAVAYSEATGRPATLALRDLVAEARNEGAADTLSLYGDEPTAPVAIPETGSAQDDEVTEPRIRPSLDRYEPAASAFVPETGRDREDEMTEPLIPPAPPKITATRHTSTDATVRAAVPEAGTAAASAVQRTDQPRAADAEVGATARQSVKPRDLTRELARAKLPGEVSKYLKKQIGNRNIADSGELARLGNKRLAEWVMENRVGQWYLQARKDKGVKRMAQRDGTVSVPSSLVNDVARSISDSPVLKHYPDVKVHARALVAAHVRRELSGETA